MGAGRGVVAAKSPVRLMVGKKKNERSARDTKNG